MNNDKYLVKENGILVLTDDLGARHLFASKPEAPETPKEAFRYMLHALGHELETGAPYALSLVHEMLWYDGDTLFYPKGRGEDEALHPELVLEHEEMQDWLQEFGSPDLQRLLAATNRSLQRQPHMDYQQVSSLVADFVMKDGKKLAYAIDANLNQVVMDRLEELGLADQFCHHMECTQNRIFVINSMPECNPSRVLDWIFLYATPMQRCLAALRCVGYNIGPILEEMNWPYLPFEDK